MTHNYYSIYASLCQKCYITYYDISDWTLAKFRCEHGYLKKGDQASHICCAVIVSCVNQKSFAGLEIVGHDYCGRVFVTYTSQ